jgi:hypothetical protein
LKGQLVVREKLYGQSAKAAAKAEQVTLLFCTLVNFLKNVYKFILGLQNMQLGVPLEILGAIANINWMRQVNKILKTCDFYSLFLHHPTDV